MDNTLIVSCTDKATAFFTQHLSEASVEQIVTAGSCAQARRMLLESDFDLIIINAPLKDETGEHFARDIAEKGASQVMLVVKAELYDTVSEAYEETGIFTVAKPINKDIFRTALKIIKSTRRIIKKAYAENEKLRQKIEDIRIVDRAKYLLIAQMNMEERDAHRFIEKQAMDMRSTKRSVAERILKTYEQ